MINQLTTATVQPTAIPELATVVTPMSRYGAARVKDEDILSVASRLVAHQDSAAYMATAAVAPRVLFWKPSHESAEYVSIVSMPNVRTVLVEFDDGRRLTVRPVHLWDRMNNRTSLPTGKRWIARVLGSVVYEARTNADSE